MPALNPHESADYDECPSGGPYLARERVQALAGDIFKILHALPHALPHVRQQVKQWAEAYAMAVQAENDFQRRLDEHTIKVLADKQLRAKKSPGRGWTRQRLRTPLIKLGRKPGSRFPKKKRTVGGWVPPELDSANRPVARLPLPLPHSPDDELSFPESCAVLAAICDGALKGKENVDPWKYLNKNRTADSDMMHAIAPYRSLISLIWEIPEEEEGSLRALLEQVRGNLAKAKAAGESRITKTDGQTGVADLSEEERMAWQLHALSGMKQTDIARTMTERLGRKVEQWQVSRWLKKAKNHPMAREGSKNLPPPIGKPASFDSGLLDIGAREDSLTPRQRSQWRPESES